MSIPVSHILINPWFSKENQESFTLVYSGDNINDCIKYFWSQLSHKNFILDPLYNVQNFPFFIYDKLSEKIRYFILNTGLDDGRVRLEYMEQPSSMNINNLRKFDNYYTRLIGQCCVNLDLSNMRRIDRHIMFPKFRRSLFLTY